MTLASTKRKTQPRESLAAQPTSANPLNDAPLGALAALGLGCWFGLLDGYLELVSMLVRCNWIEHRYYNMSRHFPWMFPVAGLLIFGAIGIAFAVLSLLRRRWVTLPRVSGLLAFALSLSLLLRWPIYTLACLMLAAGLAAQTARMVSDHTRGIRTCVRMSMPVLIGLLAILVALSYGREFQAELRSRASPVAATSDARNVLLIVLDTVRAQSLSLYGYDRDTSPNLARLAERGVRFDWAIAPAPWTLPTHASLFTGRWPHELTTGWNQPLEAGIPTLAEFLTARGYRTAGFVGNTYYCSYESGLNRGFGHYEDYDVSAWRIVLCSALVQRGVTIARSRLGLWGLFDDVKQPKAHRKSAARINADFLRWLAQPDERPFFAFLNYFDAHHPYLTPEPGDSHFGVRPSSKADYVTLRTWWDSKKTTLSPHQLALANDAYDDCIASLDRQLGRLFEELDRLGLLERTVVVLTADHGEHLGEHGIFGHGSSLYRPEVHVPLLILSKSGAPAGRVVREPVSLRDLPQTVAELLGLKDQAPFPGQSLVSTWGDRSEADAGRAPPLAELDGPPEADPNHGHSPAGRGPMSSVWLDGHHYIRSGQGTEELFDLATDPAEAHNLAASPHAAATLARCLAALEKMRLEKSSSPGDRHE